MDALGGIMDPVVSTMACNADLFRFCHASRGTRAECRRLGVPERCAAEWAAASALHAARSEVARCRTAVEAALATDIRVVQEEGHFARPLEYVVIMWEGGINICINEPRFRGPRLVSVSSAHLRDETALDFDLFDGPDEAFDAAPHAHINGRVDGATITEWMCRFFNTHRQQLPAIMDRLIEVDISAANRHTNYDAIINTAHAIRALARAVLAVPATDFRPMVFE